MNITNDRLKEMMATWYANGPVEIKAICRELIAAREVRDTPLVCSFMRRFGQSDFKEKLNAYDKIRNGDGE